MNLHDLASAGGGGSWQAPVRPPFMGILQHSGAPHAENPYLLGGVVTVTWADIEPANGVFNWELLEQRIAAWARHGKRVAVQVLLSSTPKVASVTTGWEGTVPGSSTPGSSTPGSADRGNAALPPWLRGLGIPQAPAPSGTVQPHQYWNPIFASALQRMVHEMGGRFDGRPEILYVYAAVGCDGRTALEDPGPRELTNTGPSRGMLWRSIGYSEARWLETVCSILTFYRAGFEVTPTVAQIVHPFLRQPENVPGGSAAVYVREDGGTENPVSELLAFVQSQRMWVEYDCRSTDTPPVEPEWNQGTLIVNPRRSAAMQGRPVMADLHRIVGMGASYALVHATDLSNLRNAPALEWAARGANY